MSGSERINGANGMSDMEGKAARVGASERGQRTSFKTPRYLGKGKRLSTKGSLAGRSINSHPMRISENGKDHKIGGQKEMISLTASCYAKHLCQYLALPPFDRNFFATLE